MSSADGPVFVPSTDGVEVALWDLGGEGPGLLLAHATMLCGHVWLPVAARLTGDFHVWALDFRQHGHSRTPEDADVSWEAMARDVLAVADHLGGVRLAAGHSMGGAALILAEQARPATFERLWTYDPVIRPPGAADGDPAQVQLVAGARRRQEVFPSRRHAYERFSSKPPLSGADETAVQAYVEWGFVDQPDGSVRLRCPAEREALIYELGSRHRAFDHLAEVACPVAVAHGPDQPGRPTLAGAEVARRLARGREVVFDDLTHFGPLEDPARIAASIREALQA